MFVVANAASNDRLGSNSNQYENLAHMEMSRDLMFTFDCISFRIFKLSQEQHKKKMLIFPTINTT